MKRSVSAQQSGFTIIEISIVLAIAGLFLLIVFLAVPSLQRSNLNHQRKQDITAILSAVSRYSLNNSGEFPSDCHNQADTTCYLYYTSKLNFYSAASVNVVTSVAASVSNTNPETVSVLYYRKCSDDGSASSTAAGSRDVVALFALAVRTGSPTSQCQQL